MLTIVNQKSLIFSLFQLYELYRIEVVETEESYISQASFLDDDFVAQIC